MAKVFRVFELNLVFDKISLLVDVVLLKDLSSKLISLIPII